MRIAVDARPLCHPMTGIGRYTQNVLSRLLEHDEHEWYIYSDRPLKVALPESAHVRYRSLPTGIPLLGTIVCQVLFPLWSLQDQIQVFWAPGQHLPLCLPRNLRKVLTIHDLVWLQHPETMHTRARWLDRLLIKRGIRSADNILTVSEITAEGLVEDLEVEPGRLNITLLAPTPLEEGCSPSLPEELVGSRFLLFVGTLEPRKNLACLLDAFTMLRTDYPDHKLAICGAGGWGAQSVDDQVRQRGLAASVVITGYVGESELHGLYENCDLLAMPSLYEGFGLPALEALAYGKVVVVSPNTEIARLESPLIHVCNDVGVNAIHRTLIEALIAPKIQAPPLDLSWEKTAESTLKLLIQ